MRLNKGIIERTPEISNEEIYKTLTDISNIGNRWPGTKGEEKAFHYMKDKMSLYVDEVRVEEFLFPEYTPLFSSIEIKQPYQDNIKSIPLEYSKNSTVKGELIYIGEATEDHINFLVGKGISLKNKIALAHTIRPYNMCKLITELGIKGIIIISDAPFGEIRQLVSQMGFEEDEDFHKFGVSIPGVIIDQSCGEKLLSLLSSSEIVVEIGHKSKIEIKKSYNVIGSLKGNKYADENVIIGAHYDTQLEIEGAWDNGSGCAALLEICKICSKTESKRTMTFCAFGCEEIGLFGSTNFVRNRKSNVKNIISYSNLDSTSSDVGYIHRILASENALDFMVRIIKDNTDWNTNQYRAFTKLDHEQDCGEFFKLGISSLWASEEGNPFFHTKFDNIDIVSPGNLARSTKVSLLPFYYLANIEEIPFTMNNI